MARDGTKSIASQKIRETQDTAVQLEAARSIKVPGQDSSNCLFVVQRGRGRSGRAPSGRGRMRRRGPSGGGTFRRKFPQQGQRPSFATGPVTSTRSQWPRASHKGLIHCTVKPGKYCIVSPHRPQSPGNSRGKHTLTAARRDHRNPWRPCCLRRSPERELLGRDPQLRPPGRGPRGNSEPNGADSPPSTLWCQEKNTTRYCGKVAAVKSVVFDAAEFCGAKARCSSHAIEQVGAECAGEIARRLSAY